MPVSESLSITQSVLTEVIAGLTSTPKTLSPWLFYDTEGSALFEKITSLPEYYLTRTERALLAAHSEEILRSIGSPITIAELGAGTAAKTGLLLRAASSLQANVLYQPVDVSHSSLEEARTLEASIPNLTVIPQIANYITDPIHIHRPDGTKILALYIGSSIGNFSPTEARGILINLRSRLLPGDALLLGTDLAPGPGKSIATLLAAYDDAQGVTAAFNRNILHRLNRDLGTHFRPDCFRHVARWNPFDSRVEMHLESLTSQVVHLADHLVLNFTPGETIHTENSHKFTSSAIAELLHKAGFAPSRTLLDPHALYAVNLAEAV